jgi:hypothetical protein
VVADQGSSVGRENPPAFHKLTLGIGDQEIIYSLEPRWKVDRVAGEVTRTLVIALRSLSNCRDRFCFWERRVKSGQCARDFIRPIVKKNVSLKRLPAGRWNGVGRWNCMAEARRRTFQILRPHRRGGNAARFSTSGIRKTRGIQPSATDYLHIEPQTLISPAQRNSFASIEQGGLGRYLPVRAMLFGKPAGDWSG